MPQTEIQLLLMTAVGTLAFGGLEYLFWSFLLGFC